MLEPGTYRNERDAVIVVERVLVGVGAHGSGSGGELVYAARAVDTTGTMPDEGLLVTEHALHDAGYRLLGAR
ncbi:hypothetical protein [Curtobacterium sp. Leaf261]|uniref:hypothetical protein n=1 Tax=Curtobacterium sp. Leaf261 TaxID=1736311 RepID=UPI0006FD416B|nr:hypothetical protein [Curtobacterium sp. Leaf261]KQO64760.1 hypothetical protein ASF23_00735 [Curtobacterium sp. Leaf261]